MITHAYLRIHVYRHQFDTCDHRYTYSHTYTCKFTYMHSHVHAMIYRCIHTGIHTHFHVYIHPYIHAWIHTCIHSDMHLMHTYIHAYKHRYINIYAYHSYPFPWQSMLLFHTAPGGGGLIAQRGEGDMGAIHNEVSSYSPLHHLPDERSLGFRAWQLPPNTSSNQSRDLKPFRCCPRLMLFKCLRSFPNVPKQK